MNNDPRSYSNAIEFQNPVDFVPDGRFIVIPGKCADARLRELEQSSNGYFRIERKKPDRSGARGVPGSSATHYDVVMNDPEFPRNPEVSAMPCSLEELKWRANRATSARFPKNFFSCLHEKRARGQFLRGYDFGASRCITVRDDDSVKIKNKVKTLGLPQLRMERTTADRSSRREALSRRSSRS